MKIAGLIVGILITILSAIGVVIGVLLPALTHNKINMGEAMVVIVPSFLFLGLGLLISIIFLIFVIKGRKTAVNKVG